MLQHRAAFCQFHWARMARFRPSCAYSAADPHLRRLPLSLDLPILGAATAAGSPSPRAVA
jgi:hypothetical protein